MRCPYRPSKRQFANDWTKGEPEPLAAVLIRQQAREIDDLWDRLVTPMPSFAVSPR